MKVLIVYYSRSGSTEKVANNLKEKLEKEGHDVDVERIEPVKERSFWGWQLTRVFRSRCPIKEPRIKDVSEYNVVCMGSPNWTRLSLPVAEYIRKVKGIKHKKVGFFFTSALPEALEQFIFSGYLLNSTAQGEVEAKRARVVDMVTFSSVFTTWSVSSAYGRKKIKRFCENIEGSISSIKKHLLERKNILENQLLSVVFSSLIILLLISHLFSPGITAFQYGLAYFMSFLGFIVLQSRIKDMEFKKYAASWLLIFIFILPVIFFPELRRIAVIWYLFLFLLMASFKDVKLVITSGFMGSAVLLLVALTGPVAEYSEAIFHTLTFSIGWVMVALFTFNLNRDFMSILEQQEDLEASREMLEVRVNARTKELQELNEKLEEKVKKRTKKLQSRINDLEKFQRVTVGRELKMLDLKKQVKEKDKKIKELQKKLKELGGEPESKKEK